MNKSDLKTSANLIIEEILCDDGTAFPTLFRQFGFKHPYAGILTCLIRDYRDGCDKYHYIETVRRYCNSFDMTKTENTYKEILWSALTAQVGVDV